MEKHGRCKSLWRLASLKSSWTGSKEASRFTASLILKTFYLSVPHVQELYSDV